MPADMPHARTDHGYMLGEHGRFEKHCGYDPALRVPLSIRYPGRYAPRVVRDLTEHVDLTSTILDILDAPPLPVQHGRSLSPYLERGKHSQPRDHIFSEYLENEEAYIRTHDYKFIYCTGRRARTKGYITDNPTPGRYVRLYDLRKDAGEYHDISHSQPKRVAALKSLLLEGSAAPIRTPPQSPGPQIMTRSSIGICALPTPKS